VLEDLKCLSAAGSDKSATKVKLPAEAILEEPCAIVAHPTSKLLSTPAEKLSNVILDALATSEGSKPQLCISAYVTVVCEFTKANARLHAKLLSPVLEATQYLLTGA
jgi:hypothetical protein